MACRTVTSESRSLHTLAFRAQTPYTPQTRLHAKSVSAVIHSLVGSLSRPLGRRLRPLEPVRLAQSRVAPMLTVSFGVCVCLCVGRSKGAAPLSRGRLASTAGAGPNAVPRLGTPARCIASLRAPHTPPRRARGAGVRPVATPGAPAAQASWALP